MTLSAETRVEQNTLVLRISMRFEPRGGRKRIVAPDGECHRAQFQAGAGRQIRFRHCQHLSAHAVR
jgi:hypothetical protein